MSSLLVITASSGATPEFSFLEAHGFAVTHLPDTTPDLASHFAAHDVLIIACETRTTQHARIAWEDRAFSLYVRGGGRVLFCAPSLGAWSFVWSAFPILLPATPIKTHAAAENFSDRFRWARWKEQPRSLRVIPPDHPAFSNLRDWPAFHLGAMPGSYNAYDFERWEPKPHTEVAIRTEDGQAALAFMPFGAGRTGFLLADLHDDAGASWREWLDRERFWVALLNHFVSGELRLERAPAGLVPFRPCVPLIARPRFVFSRGPQVGNPEWARILTRTDWVMLADNQIAVNVSPTPLVREPETYGDGWHREPKAEPGIGQVKFYPPAQQFDAALSIDLLADGCVLDLQPVPDAYRWQPHVVVNRFASPDGAVVIEKRQCVADDVVAVELRLVQGRADTARLRGWNRHHGFLREDNGALLGQIESGLLFGVSVSRDAGWHTREAPLRYETEIPFDEILTAAFTASMEPGVVEGRLAAFRRDPENVFTAAHDKWNQLFLEQVPAFRSEDPMVERIIYGAFLGYLINLHDVPHEPWLAPHSCPSKMHFDPQWEQDDVQVATIAKWLRDPTVLVEHLLRPFRRGFVLNINAAYGEVTDPVQGLIGELQQYSVPLRELYLFAGTPALRRDLLAAMLREEDANAEFTPVDAATGLNVTFNCLGMDDSPRWDLVSPGQKAEWFQSFERPMITPDVNATIAHRERFLAELLAAENDPRAAGFAELAARRKARIREHLWSRDAGIFVDRIAGEDHASDVLTPMSFVPLLLGPYDDEVGIGAARLLRDEAVFRTPYGLPTVARNHPKFEAGSYWRGSIWSRTNWFAVEALQAAGLRAETADLTGRWLELVKKNGADLRENFNPLTGEAKCATMFTEGLSAMADVYLKNVVGFRPTLAGFDLDPVALDATTPSFAFGPFRYRQREITITWDRVAGGGEIRIDETSLPWNPGMRREFSIPLPI